MTKYELYELYVVQHLSIRKVANSVEMSPSGVRYLLEKFEIKIRTKSEAQLGQYNPSYKSQHRKGTKHSRSSIEKMSKSKSGSNNPMFNKNRNDLKIKFKGKGNPFFGKKHSLVVLEKNLMPIDQNNFGTLTME